MHGRLSGLAAYKAPMPQPIVDCLEQNPTGCCYVDWGRYFDEQVFDPREYFSPEVCQENARWARLAPRKVTRRKQVNPPLRRSRAGRINSLTFLAWTRYDPD
jgi:hypothetical protein